MSIFTMIVGIANLLYWAFLGVYIVIRLLGHFDNVRYLADCQRVDGGRLRVIAERGIPEEGKEGAPDSGAAEEAGEVEFRETPWLPFLMVFIVLFLLLVLCLSWEAWTAKESLIALLGL